MSQNINIQELVNEIGQPNAVCLINNDVPKNPEERNLHIIYSLVNIVKQCIIKGMYTPYIHVKDIHGKLHFNDRLYIKETEVDQEAMNYPGYCDIHLVKSKDSLTAYYCATTPKSMANNQSFYLNIINFSNGTLDREAYEQAKEAILNMVKREEGIDDSTNVNTSFTVHNYEAKDKTWQIVYYTSKHTLL